MWADERVTSFIGGAAAGSQDQLDQVHSGRGLWPLMGYGYWLAFERDGGALAGVGGLARFERGVPSLEGYPEAGWAFGADSWGKGYATEFMPPYSPGPTRKRSAKSAASSPPATMPRSASPKMRLCTRIADDGEYMVFARQAASRRPRRPVVVVIILAARISPGQHARTDHMPGDRRDQILALRVRLQVRLGIEREQLEHIIVRRRARWADRAAATLRPVGCSCRHRPLHSPSPSATIAPSGRCCVSGGRRHTIAWLTGSGNGASGSSTTSARLAVPSGNTPHTRGGEIPAPSAVNRSGSRAPSAKAGDDRSIFGVPLAILSTTSLSCPARAPREEAAEPMGNMFKHNGSSRHARSGSVMR